MCLNTIFLKKTIWLIIFYFCSFYLWSDYDNFSEPHELEDIQEFESEDKFLRENIEETENADKTKEQEQIKPVEKKEIRETKKELENVKSLEKKKQAQIKVRLEKKKKNLEEKAMAAEKARKWQTAILYYQELLKNFGENAYYQYRIGRVYSYLKSWNLSKQYLKESLKNNPDNLNARLALSRMYYWAKEYAKAKKELKIIIKKRPDYLDTHLLLAQVYTALGKKEKAEKHFQKTLKKRPQDTSVLLPYAQLHFSNKNYRQAQTYYDHSLSLANKTDQKTIEERLITIRPYVNPSITYDTSYYREREMDLVTKIKTVQLEIFNNFLQIIMPVNNHFRPYVFFDSFFKKQHNLIDRTNNYNTNNYLYSLGGEFFLKKYWTIKLEATIRQSENSRTNIFDFHDTIHFEPLVAIRFATPCYLLFISGVIDGLIGRDFANYYSYLVKRQHTIAILEYRFYPPLCGIGIENKEFFYSNPIFNRKDRFAIWGRAGINFLTCDWMIQYQYDYQSFHKTIADYYSFRRENSQWIKLLFFKKIHPNREIEISYEHLWRKTKDITNEATVIEYGTIPEVLKSNQYEADIINTRLKLILSRRLHLEFSGTGYRNTNNYNVLLGKLHFKWVF